jgi:hypothetical protein
MFSTIVLWLYSLLTCLRHCFIRRSSKFYKDIIDRQKTKLRASSNSWSGIRPSRPYAQRHGMEWPNVCHSHFEIRSGRALSLHAELLEPIVSDDKGLGAFAVRAKVGSKKASSSGTHRRVSWNDCRANPSLFERRHYRRRSICSPVANRSAQTNTSIVMMDLFTIHLSSA